VESPGIGGRAATPRAGQAKPAESQQEARQSRAWPSSRQSGEEFQHSQPRPPDGDEEKFSARSDMCDQCLRDGADDGGETTPGQVMRAVALAVRAFEALRAREHGDRRHRALPKPCTARAAMNSEVLRRPQGGTHGEHDDPIQHLGGRRGRRASGTGTNSIGHNRRDADAHASAQSEDRPLRSDVERWCPSEKLLEEGDSDDQRPVGRRRGRSLSPGPASQMRS